MQPRFWPFILALSFFVTGCGGGSSSGGPGAPPLASPSPNASPTPAPFVPGPGFGPGSGAAASFVAATGPITLIPSNGSGGVGTTLLGSSASGVFAIESADTPAESFATNLAVATLNVSAAETAGLATAGRGRSLLTAPAARAPAHPSNDRETLWEKPHPEFGRTMQLLRTLQGRATGHRTTLAASPSPPPTVGSTRTFHITTSSIGNSGGACATPHTNFDCYTDITATLKYQGLHSEVWVDNTSLGDPNEFPSGDSDFASVGTNFDTYYQGETQQYFGPAFLSQSIDFTPQCDASGNQLPSSSHTQPDLTGASGDSSGGRIDIVITDVLAGTGEGGYFFGGNFIAQQVLNCGSAPHQISNEVPMFVMSGDKYIADASQSLGTYNEGYWLATDAPRTMAHELQHALHFMNKVLAPYLTGGTPTQDDSFIDEGCSMLAEDLVANGIAIDTPRYSYSYLLEPNLFSLTAFTGYQPNPTSTAPSAPYGFYTNTAGSYGFSYLMMRYIYDRFGQAGITALYASQMPHAGPVVAAAGGEPFAQFYQEFITAIANQSGGAGAVSTDPRYRFGSELILRGPTTVTSRRTGALSTRHLVFGGPQAPEVFSPALLPTSRVQLTVGQAVPLTLIDGATIFLPLAGPGSSGSTVRATGGPAGMQGAMVQGLVPTPQPTSF